jgi:hypothetical protein
LKYGGMMNSSFFMAMRRPSSLLRRVGGYNRPAPLRPR